MQKFALIFLSLTTALLVFVSPVAGQELVERETNAERFARGMPPLPPVKRSPTELAKRERPSKRDEDPTPTVEKRSRPSKRDVTPVEKRDRPSKRASVPDLEKRTRPSKRADSVDVEKRSRPSKRATSVEVEKRSRPSKRASSVEVEKRSRPSKRATTVDVEKRSRPSKRATTPAVEKRSRPSKRATTPVVEKRSRPSKRATTPTVEKRSRPSKRATTPVVEKRAEVFQMQQAFSGRLEVRWANNDSLAGYVGNNPTGGPFGLADPMLFGDDDLYVRYMGSNLLAVNPEFPPPYYVGGTGSVASAHDCSKGKIQFANVAPGPFTPIWTVNPLTGALNATWVNQDGSESRPSLAYDPAHNVLSFTAPSNIQALYPVNIYLSD